jgi:hypothetical protein
MELDLELLRWILLIGAAPIWWPFLRTVWRDIDEALAEEGGVFGRAPGPRELERIRRRKAEQPDPLHSEPWVRPDAPSGSGGFQRHARRGRFR